MRVPIRLTWIFRPIVAVRDSNLLAARWNKNRRDFGSKVGGDMPKERRFPHLRDALWLKAYLAGQLKAMAAARTGLLFILPGVQRVYTLIFNKQLGWTCIREGLLWRGWRPAKKMQWRMPVTGAAKADDRRVCVAVLQTLLNSKQVPCGRCATVAHRCPNLPCRAQRFLALASQQHRSVAVFFVGTVKPGGTC